MRELHAEMDRAVLHAYGWDDIPTDCEFLLDYEIDEEEWGNKRKPYRYRWPDDVRDEVLARLIELNAERAAEEQRSGHAAADQHRPAAARSREQPRAGDGGCSETRVRRLRTDAPADALEVRERLVEALELDLVGPWPGHEFWTRCCPAGSGRRTGT